MFEFLKSLMRKKTKKEIIINHEALETRVAVMEEGKLEDFFIERYGEWLLLAPPADRRNLLIYVTPGLVLGGGLAWAVYTVFLWRREPDDVPLPSDMGHAAKDRYEQRLLAELED